MNDQLFIIGNGFDLHHQIPSKFSDFGAYLRTHDPDVFQYAEKYLMHSGDLWSNFEECLAYLDDDQIIDEAEHFLVSYGAEDWSDAYHHDYEYEIGQIVQGLSSKLRDHFADWVRSLSVPSSFQGTMVRCIDPASKFLNFNYTPTLQNLYSVPDANILHIHGSAADPNANIILGHGWERSSEEMLSRFVDEDTDIRVAGGYRIIDRYFGDTFKNSAHIIEREAKFFNSLSAVRQIWVLGHSLSPVDHLYFEHIISLVSPNARWTVSYNSNASKIESALANYGLDASKYSVRRLSDL